MLTCIDIDVVPLCVLSCVTLDSGEQVWVGADDGYSPYGEEVEEYDDSRLTPRSLSLIEQGVFGEGARRIALNYSRGILTGAECDRKLSALLS